MPCDPGLELHCPFSNVVSSEEKKKQQLNKCMPQTCQLLSCLNSVVKTVLLQLMKVNYLSLYQHPEDVNACRIQNFAYTSFLTFLNESV